MTVTASVDGYNFINGCEAAADWTGESPADVADFFKYGTQCVGFVFRGVGDNDSYITVAEDLSGTAHLRFWFMTTAINELNTDANGGIQVYLSDGANTGYWYVGGSTTYPGGWYNIVVDLSRDVDSGTKPTMTAITTLGIRINQTAAPKNVQNTWIDHIYAGNGIISYGDDGGSAYDLDDILAIDQNTTYGWGILRKISGIYYLNGKLIFGDASGTNSCEFADASEIIIFEDRKVNDALYSITVVGNGTGTTNFKLGTKAGTAGVEGCVIKAEGTKKYDVICTDTDVAYFKLYGCTFLDADVIQLPLYSSGNREMLNCNVEASAQIEASTCTITNLNIITADTRGVLITGETFYMTDSALINCPSGIHINTSGTFNLDAIQFINCVWDIENSSAGNVIINNLPGSNASTYVNTGGGTVTIQTSVYITIDVEDTDGNPIVSGRVAVYKTSDDSELMREYTTAAGQAQEVFNYVEDTDIYVRIRKSSVGETRYYPYNTTGEITDGGYTLTAVMIEDTIVQ